ncbi:hypothetical protein C8R47DRAFT_1062920 [Mycena vitilis]|nr:hypothetical protein C8R47DRAFT_1062920 [Mycena vitilis]
MTTRCSSRYPALIVLALVISAWETTGSESTRSRSPVSLMSPPTLQNIVEVDIWFDALGEDPALVSEYLGAYLKAGLVGGAEGGHVYFAENEDKDIVGVTVWFPPGQTAMGSEEQRAAGWNQLMSKLSKETQEWWTHMLTIVYDDFVASESVLGPAGFILMNGCANPSAKCGLFGHTVTAVRLIGIHLDYQERGVAKKMISIVEDEARKQKTICVLEAADAEHATGVYKALGYKIRGIRPGIPDVKGNPTICFYSLSKGTST